MSAERTRIAVAAGDGTAGYDVHIGRGLLDELGDLVVAAAPAVRRWVVISDENVGELYGERACAAMEGALHVPTPLFTFPAGEQHKNRHAWAGLSDALLGEGLGRDGGVIALGGGVTGDLAGFVAATYLRGIPVVQVPTSIVAMVDSSVGGKTGVDTPAGKNLIGAFHRPSVVVADPEVIATLPRRERSQGLAEAVKHGAIVDAEYLDRLEADAEALLDADPAALEAMVVRSVEIKARVVEHDEKEAGLREILNFGHTLGHALEAASEFALPHGSAVAVGMVLEARLGADLGITEVGVAQRLAEVLGRMELPTAPADEPDLDTVLRFTHSDKKARSGNVRYVLLEAVGRVSAGARGWAREVPDEAVRSMLATGGPSA